MTSIVTNWDASWTATSIASSAIADDATDTTSAAIDNDNKTSTEVSITVTYGSPADVGVVVYVLRDVDGTNYEATTDLPYAFTMPVTISTTHRRTIVVPAQQVSKFKVAIHNPSGASVTASVSYRQATDDLV